MPKTHAEGAPMAAAYGDARGEVFHQHEIAAAHVAVFAAVPFTARPLNRRRLRQQPFAMRVGRWHYTPEFNAQLEQACFRKPDYMFGRTQCLDFATQAKAHTESAPQK